MRLKLGMVGVLAVLCVGCAATVVPGATTDKAGRSVFSARGQAIAAKEDDPVARAEAEVAAAVIAKANLLELVKGAHVESGVSVGDLMLKSQEAKVEVEGFLSRATVVVEPAAASRLGSSPIVTATATLVLDCEDLANLDAYVE